MFKPKEVVDYIFGEGLKNKKKTTLTFFVLTLVSILFAILKGFNFLSLGMINWLFLIGIWITLYVVLMIYANDEERAAKERETAEESSKIDDSERDVTDYFKTITEKKRLTYRNQDWKIEVRLKDNEWIATLYHQNDIVAERLL